MDKKAFSKTVSDFKQMIPVLEHLGVKLAGGLGEGKPEINSQVIRFNGVRKCGHNSRDLGITWPSKDASGVASIFQHKRITNEVSGQWFAGLQLNTRTCDGNCEHETFTLERVLNPQFWQKPHTEENIKNKYFSCTKTAYKPYDLAVNICLIIADHYLKNQIVINSDGELEQWKDAIAVCQHFLGYGEEFKLKD